MIIFKGITQSLLLPFLLRFPYHWLEFRTSGNQSFIRKFDQLVDIHSLITIGYQMKKPRQTRGCIYQLVN